MSVQKPNGRNIPKKTGINLAMREDHSGSLRTLVIGSILIVLLAGAVAKFGVIDQYARLSAAAEAYRKVHSQQESLKEALVDYDKVEADYRTHAMDWLESDKDGFVRVDRLQVLDLMEAVLMSRGTVNRITVYGDVLSVSMSGMNLSDISDMILVLQESPIVQRVDLDYAQTENIGTGDLLDFSLTIVLQPEEVAQ